VYRSIRRLKPEAASRIAAGEVIERPLSALKEILENSLDAGARSIEIRVERSLDHSFQVADDGLGIHADELELALERHATSKIEVLEDLERIDSLGFRGEALPSISAVSRLTITSRTRDSESAFFLATAGGQLVGHGSQARAPGTTVEVSELFFNTPARRKFLHSPAGELRAAMRMLECYALGFPEVSFRLVVDGRERLSWPVSVPGAGPTSTSDGTGSAGRATLEPDTALTSEERRARAGTVRGARLAAQLVEAEGERNGIRLAALLGLPEHARATREGQVFLVNRRWIQSPMLGNALRKAYGDLLPGGRFPAGTLWLTVPPARLDVNVHPTKREVRFADEDAVFGLVAGACAKALAHLHPPFTVVRGGQPAEPSWADRVRESPANQTFLGLETGAGEPPATAALEPGGPPGSGIPVPGPLAARGRPPTEGQEPELWQLHRTYIMAPVRGGLVIVDQHAAHERILYEQARARLEGERGASQQLLFPALIDLSRSQFELMVELAPWLEKLGWNLAPLGPPSVVIQGVPSDLKHEHPGLFLQDVLDAVSEGSGRSATEDVVEQLARSHACHAAIRAGDPLTQAEMRALVDRLFATSRPHGDPHGRATFVRLELDELHRRFGRA
jgi:DNA mismatch repair protein MutL